jgi:hypothetical protein
VDAAPGDADRVDARRARRADVEGRVADVDGVLRRGAEPLEREQDRRRVGLVPLGVVGAHDRLEVVAERQPREREVDGLAPLRRDDPEPAAPGVQPVEHVVHPGAALELVVERRVVPSVGDDELLDAVGRDRRHLLVQARASHPRGDPHVRDLALQHLLRRVPEGGHDDRAGVDDRAVEVEEDDGKAHGFDGMRSCGVCSWA